VKKAHVSELEISENLSYFTKGTNISKKKEDEPRKRVSSD
jgi:hypothetical protein